MPRTKEFGDRIINADLGPRLVKQIPTAKTVAPPIQGARFARNGQLPDVALINAMNEQANHCALYRTKEVFRAVGPMIREVSSLISGVVVSKAGAGDRGRWRFAFHTGPYTHSLRATVVLAPSTVGALSAYGRLDIANGAGAVVSTAKFFHGIGSSVTDGWPHLKAVTMYLSVDPDTDYYGTFTDVDEARMVSAVVYELPSMTEHFDGYLPTNIATQSNVLDVYRQNLVTIQNALWKRGGATVLNWTINADDRAEGVGGPRTTTSSTQTNIIDKSSTAVTSSSPGYTLDLSYQNRVSETSGVPCRMVAYGKLSGAGTDGRVYLKSAGGGTIASIVDQWTSSTPAWKTSAVFNLPATVDKYDLQFARITGGITFTLYAVSIYQYGS